MMVQGFFLRICRVDVVPQNCGVAARSPPARGDDDRHARREEQRASGLAKVVKSNLGKPGLSSGRGRGRCGGQPFAAVASMPAGRYSRVVGGRVLSSLSARAGRLRRRRLLTCVNANGEVVGLARRDSRPLVSGFPLVREVHHLTHVFHVGLCPIFVYIFRTRVRNRSRS